MFFVDESEKCTKTKTKWMTLRIARKRYYWVTFCQIAIWLFLCVFFNNCVQIISSTHNDNVANFSEFPNSAHLTPQKPHQVLLCEEIKQRHMIMSDKYRVHGSTNIKTTHTHKGTKPSPLPPVPSMPNIRQVVNKLYPAPMYTDEFRRTMGSGVIASLPPGTGKTHIIITEVANYYVHCKSVGDAEPGATLIVVPATMINSWVSEFLMHWPDMPDYFLQVVGKVEKDKMAPRFPTLSRAKPYILLCSYETLVAMFKRGNAHLFGQNVFSLITMDECHYIRNHSGQRMKVHVHFALMSKHSTNVFCLGHVVLDFAQPSQSQVCP